MTALVRGGDGRLDLSRINEQGVRVHVGEDRGSALVEHAVGCGRKGHGRHHDLVARADVKRVYGRMQGGRAVAHGPRRGPRR